MRISRQYRLILILTAGIVPRTDLLCAQTMPGPSLAETVEWMANTLKASEGNNAVVHRPTPRPYPKKWVEEKIDPYHSEVITSFSHHACRVEFDVDILDNDIFPLMGKYTLDQIVLTFDLTDLDPESVSIQNSCAPVETSSGPVEPWNCEDIQGKFVIFRTSDARPKIRQESFYSSGKSGHGFYQVGIHAKNNLDQMCKEFPGNTAYCDVAKHKETPSDLAFKSLGFTTPAYAKRFATAFRHAVELCAGKKSAF